MIELLHNYILSLQITTCDLARGLLGTLTYFTTNSEGGKATGGVWQGGLPAYFTTNSEGGKATGGVWRVS